MANAEYEHFAVLLRTLKERSGRSYGALASRLSVGTSTLYRYCNGDAVPGEFAPVERFARLCGATREEAVELHRRWILADESRRRARSGAAASRAEAAGTAPAGAADADAEGAGTDAEGAGTDADAAPAGAEGRGGPEGGAGAAEAGRQAPDAPLATAPEAGAVTAPDGPGAAEAAAEPDAPDAAGRDAGAREAAPGAGAGGPAAGSAGAEGPALGSAGSGTGGAGSKAARDVAAGAGRGPGASADGRERAGADKADGGEGTEASGAGAPGAGASGAGESAGRPGAGEGAGAEPADGPDVRHAPGGRLQGVPAGQRRTGPRRPGRRTLLAVSAVLTATVAVTGLFLSRDHGPLARRAEAGAMAPATATPPGAAAPGPRVSADGKEARARPSDGRSSHGGGPAPSGTPAAGHRSPSAGSDAGGLPPTAAIRSYDWDKPCGTTFFVNRAPGTVPPPAPPGDRRSWLASLNGVDGGALRLELAVQGREERAVVLTGLHVRVVGRAAPLDWNLYDMGRGCGSGLAPAHFDVDLDSPQPVLRPVSGTQGDLTIPATDFPYRVSRTDPQIIDLNVHVTGYDVRWYLELEWSSGDRHGTLRVDDRGSPFRTSGTKGRPTYLYQPDGGWKVEKS